MRFSVYQESLIGGRKINQDRMGYCFTRDSLLLLLADGMGGHIQGEVAATIAVQTISALFQQQAKPRLNNPEQFLDAAIMAAHKAIFRYKDEQDLEDTPRTTIVACVIQNGSACWAHCGDSRLYWIRQGQLLLRTRDHSRLETLIARGLIDSSERDTHPDRNKLFNCLGAPKSPIIEKSRSINLSAGDIIFLCSDGLWSSLPENNLLLELTQRTIVRAVPELLQKAAILAGKNADNLTALAVMWEGGSDNASNVSTQYLPEGAVTTTIQSGFLLDQLSTVPSNIEDVDEEVFDEADIEKAIAEIRTAINTTSKFNLKN